MIISGAKVHLPQGVVKNTAIEIQENKIHAILPDTHISRLTDSERLLFPERYHVIPGLIDLHIHGANGKDVMDDDDAALQIISEALAGQGITSFLATTMTAAPLQIEKALIRVSNFMKNQSPVQGAKVLGVHLEGPFLSPNKAGAQCGDQVVQPDIHSIQHWQEQAGKCIKLVTLAPELNNSLSFIRFLKKQNIIASIGHSDATYEETLAAIGAGCSHVTHLFNAMRGIHQREPGVVTAALLSENISVELIADGVHVHPAVINLVMKTKQAEKIVLVTDAMRAQCLPDGVYDLGGQTVEVKNRVARLLDGVLAGSTLELFSAVKNMLNFTGCSLTDAVKLATENPAKTLTIFDRKGSIAVGKDADLVVLNEMLEPVLTIREGNIVYQKTISSNNKVELC